MTTDKGTAPELQAGADDDDPKSSDGERFESILHHRIKRALKKEEPEIMKRGQRQLLEQLGLDADAFSPDSFREQLEKYKLTESKVQRAERELQKLAAERDEHATARGKLEAQINSRAIHDAIMDALSDARVIPGATKQITRLLDDKFRVVDGEVVVVNADGNPARGKDVAKTVQEFLAANTHFLAPTAPQGGAGSRPPGASGGGKTPGAAPKTRDELRASFEAALKGN